MTDEQIAVFVGFEWGKIDYVSSLSPELNSTYEAWISPLTKCSDKSQPLRPEEVMEELPDFQHDLNVWEKYVFPEFPDVIMWKRNGVWSASFSPLYHGGGRGRTICKALVKALAPIIEGGKK